MNQKIKNQKIMNQKIKTKKSFYSSFKKDKTLYFNKMNKFIR